MKLFIALVFAFSTLLASAQVPSNNESNSIKELNDKIRDLTEVTAEHSEIMKRQLIDQHYDQSSRGYLELKYGLVHISPKDIEDNNDELFSDLENSNWENFDYANILELEIGKTILGKDEVKHEIGIGYQYLRSKEVQATFTPTGGGGTAKVIETISAHTMYLRYAYLSHISSTSKIYLGPGFTFGYSPVTDLSIQLEQGAEGVQVKGEGTSFLLEIFGKGKIEFSRYFSGVLTAGYRMQEAENLRLNAAEIVSLKTKTDLDLSGFFGTVGIAVSF